MKFQPIWSKFTNSEPSWDFGQNQLESQLKSFKGVFISAGTADTNQN